MTTVLRAEGVCVHYGGVQALADIDLEVADGQLVGLIGPNGAGKTTFIDAVTGFVRSRGRVTLDAEDVSSLSPDRRARAGLTRTWQSGELFDELTVHQNTAIAFGRPTVRQLAREFVRGRPDPHRAAERILRLLELEPLAAARPDQLTQGQRKLVGVARALAAEPRVVCLDEPAAGLDTEESEHLGQRLRQIVAGGTAMLLVDHDMGLVLSVCDHVVVLDFGRVIASGTPGEVRANPQVVEAYLGKAAAEVMGSA